MASMVLPLLLAAQAQPAAPAADRAAMIASARAAIERQDDRAAIATLETARAAHPDDPEILRLLGSAYAYDHRYPEAIATLRRAEQLAPADLDIKAALARAYLWSGDRDASRAEVAAIVARDPGNADAKQITAQSNAPAARRSGISLGEALSHVAIDGGEDRTWSTTTLAAFAPLGPTTVATLTAEREDRQTMIDTRIEARVDHRFGGGFLGHLAFAGTPNADFRERFSVAAGVEAPVVQGLTLLADVRRAWYGKGVAVVAFEPGARIDWRSAGFSVTARMINLWDEAGTYRTGVSSRIDKEFAGGATLYAGAATYPDTETGITRRVDAAFAGGSLHLSDRLTMRLGVDYERRKASYRRTGASLGLQLRF